MIAVALFSPGVYETRGCEVQQWARNDAKERGELRLLEMKDD